MAIETALERDAGTLAEEREVLRDYGNMSAPTVLFVLERKLANGFSGSAVLSALGPGFTASFVAAEARQWVSASSATGIGDATIRVAPTALRVPIMRRATIIAPPTTVGLDTTLPLATGITADRVWELVSARSASGCGNPQTSCNDST